MLAVLAAAVLSAAPAAVLPAQTSPLLRGRPASEACKSHGSVQVQDPALLYRQDGKAKLSRLGALPKANHEKAVLRSVDGCAKPLVVQYGAGR